MGDDYYFPSAALKLQLTDKFSFGLLYDQPFGADVEYSGNNAFVASPSDPILSGLPITTGALGGTQGGTSVEVDSQNISMILVSNLLKTLTSTVVVFTKPLKAMYIYVARLTVYITVMMLLFRKMEQLAG